MAIDATVGGENADSFADIAFADAYFLGNPHASAWSTASTATKEWAMKLAARLLNTGLPWNGSAATSTQALAFPRTGLLTATGYALASDVVPRELKQAQCELALQLIVANRLEDNEAQRLGLIGLKVGSIDLKFRNDTMKTRSIYTRKDLPTWIPDAVIALIPESWYATEDVEFLFESL